MKTFQQTFVGIALGSTLLLTLPDIAQAHDRTRVGINFSFGEPNYVQQEYVYAPPPPTYIYTQPRSVYYDRRSYERGDEYYDHPHVHWHGHHHHHHDDDDDD